MNDEDVTERMKQTLARMKLLIDSGKLSLEMKSIVTLYHDMISKSFKVAAQKKVYCLMTSQERETILSTLDSIDTIYINNAGN